MATAPSESIQDPIFLQGLESILAPMKARGASQLEIDEITLRAHQFYLSSTSSAPSQPLVDDVDSFVEPPTLPSSSSALASAAPPYPLSFSDLAKLIASGAPIPGIRDIPDRLVEGSENVSVTSERATGTLKPWETARQLADEGSTTVDVHVNAEEGQGKETEMTGGETTTM